jgi:hypothetical protein
MSMSSTSGFPGGDLDGLGASRRLTDRLQVGRGVDEEAEASPDQLTRLPACHEFRAGGLRLSWQHKVAPGSAPGPDLSDRQHCLVTAS